MKKYSEVTQEEWLRAPQEKRATRYDPENIDLKPLTGILIEDGTLENHRKLIRKYLIEEDNL